MNRNELVSFSSAALIDVIIQLTHRIHETDDDRLRKQRDAARAELLLRMTVSV